MLTFAYLLYVPRQTRVFTLEQGCTTCGPWATCGPPRLL